jgi:molybdopterin/thiamine biosynthesis adenylyltransferase
LTAGEQGALREAVICGAGAGGVAGWTYEALVRLGVRRFRIADPDVFSPSNANRQMGCSASTLGRSKPEVIAEALRAIDPEIDIALFPEGVTEGNLEGFLRGGSIVLDGIDVGGIRMKRRLHIEARACRLPVVTTPILGFGAALAIFDPVRSPSFDEFFGPIPEEGDAAGLDRYLSMVGLCFFSFAPNLDWSLVRERSVGGAIPSVAPAVLLAGSLAATAIVDVICGRSRLPVAPTTMHVDPLEGKLVRSGGMKKRIMRGIARLALRRQGPPAQHRAERT